MAQTIMIIDDEAGVRELLADALKLAGFETLTAQDAMVAQTMLRTSKADLLVVDINMPMMDGFEFIERIRSHGDNTPALMLSARADRAAGGPGAQRPRGARHADTNGRRRPLDGGAANVGRPTELQT